MKEQHEADMVDRVIRSAGKFDGNMFNEWYNHSPKSCFAQRYPGIVDIIAGYQCTDSITR